MAKRPKVGDVYEITTPAGLAYVQLTHDRRDECELVRVLPGLYAKRPDVSKLTQEKELYFVFYLLKYAVRRGQAQLVSQEPVPEWAKLFPIMRHEAIWDNTWYIGPGSLGLSPREIPKMLKVNNLTPEQRKLSISSLLRPHPAMVKELARVWTPERDKEFRQIDEAERIAREQAQARQRTAITTESKAEFLEHYLYFPKKSHAEAAAQRLRSKGWTVEVKKGADGENWLTLAKQPAPIEDDIEEIRDKLERLAEELSGEYDGWGARVKDEPSVQ